MTSSSDFAAAFEGLKRDRTREPDVWALMAALAPDEVFLNFAVRDEAEELPDLPGEELKRYDPGFLHMLLMERGRFDGSESGFSQ